MEMLPLSRTHMRATVLLVAMLVRELDKHKLMPASDYVAEVDRILEYWRTVEAPFGAKTIEEAAGAFEVFQGFKNMIEAMKAHSHRPSFTVIDGGAPSKAADPAEPK